MLTSLAIVFRSYQDLTLRTGGLRKSELPDGVPRPMSHGPQFSKRLFSWHGLLLYANFRSDSFE